VTVALLAHRVKYNCALFSPLYIASLLLEFVGELQYTTLRLRIGDQARYNAISLDLFAKSSDVPLPIVHSQHSSSMTLEDQKCSAETVKFYYRGVSQRRCPVGYSRPAPALDQ
jgi:hypothetical protein